MLDPTLDNLQYASGIAAIFATLVVVAGLVFEYAGSDATARSNWSPLTGPPSHWHAERIGEWLVIIGVVGEVLFGFIALITTTILDTNRQAEIANVRLEAERLRETNLKFERLVAPRDLIDSKKFESLRHFPGITIWVQQVPPPSSDLTGSNAVAGYADVSEFTTSFQLFKVLGWKVQTLSQPVDPPILSGVRILTFRAYPDKIWMDSPRGEAVFTMPLDTPAERSWGAAEALFQYFQSDLGLLDTDHMAIDNLKGEITTQFDKISPIPTKDIVIIQVGYKSDLNLQAFKFDQELEFNQNR